MSFKTMALSPAGADLKVIFGPGVPDALREQIASAIHVIVQVGRTANGTRRVTQLAQVQGLLVSGGYQLAAAQLPAAHSRKQGAA